MGRRQSASGIPLKNARADARMHTVCVMVPVDKKTTVLELKEAFIAAYGDGRDPSLPSMDDDELVEGAAQAKAQTVDSIKLFKHTLDEDDNDAWIPMDDHKSNVDKVGLDQGHVVGVSLKTNGEHQS